MSDDPLRRILGQLGRSSRWVVAYPPMATPEDDTVDALIFTNRLNETTSQYVINNILHTNGRICAYKINEKNRDILWTLKLRNVILRAIGSLSLDTITTTDLTTIVRRRLDHCILDYVESIEDDDMYTQTVGQIDHLFLELRKDGIRKFLHTHADLHRRVEQRERPECTWCFANDRYSIRLQLYDENQLVTALPAFADEEPLVVDTQRNLTVMDAGGFALGVQPAVSVLRCRAEFIFSSLIPKARLSELRQSESEHGFILQQSIQRLEDAFGITLETHVWMARCFGTRFSSGQTRTGKKHAMLIPLVLTDPEYERLRHSDFWGEPKHVEAELVPTSNDIVLYKQNNRSLKPGHVRMYGNWPRNTTRIPNDGKFIKAIRVHIKNKPVLWYVWKPQQKSMYDSLLGIFTPSQIAKYWSTAVSPGIQQDSNLDHRLMYPDICSSNTLRGLMSPVVRFGFPILAKLKKARTLRQEYPLRPDIITTLWAIHDGKAVARMTSFVLGNWRPVKEQQQRKPTKVYQLPPVIQSFMDISTLSPIYNKVGLLEPRNPYDIFDIVSIVLGIHDDTAIQTADTTVVQMINDATNPMTVQSFQSLNGGILDSRYVSREAVISSYQLFLEHLVHGDQDKGTFKIRRVEDFAECIHRHFNITIILVDVMDTEHRSRIACHAFRGLSGTHAIANNTRLIIVHRDVSGRMRFVVSKFDYRGRLHGAVLSPTQTRSSSVTRDHQWQFVYRHETLNTHLSYSLHLNVQDMVVHCGRRRHDYPSPHMRYAIRIWHPVPSFDDVQEDLKDTEYQIIDKRGFRVGLLVRVQDKLVHVPVQCSIPNALHTMTLRQLHNKKTLILASCKQSIQFLNTLATRHPGYTIRFGSQYALLLLCGEFSLTASDCAFFTKEKKGRKVDALFLSAVTSTLTQVDRNTPSDRPLGIPPVMQLSDAIKREHVRFIMDRNNMYTHVRSKDGWLHKLSTPVGVWSPQVPYTYPVWKSDTPYRQQSKQYPSFPVVVNYDALRSILPHREAWYAQEHAIT